MTLRKSQKNWVLGLFRRVAFCASGSGTTTRPAWFLKVGNKNAFLQQSSSGVHKKVSPLAARRMAEPFGGNATARRLLRVLEVIILGVVVPYTSFEGSLLMWTHMYPICPAMVYTWHAVLVTLALTLVLHAAHYIPHTEIRETLKEPIPGFHHPKRNLLWGLFALLMVCTGCLIGRQNYYAHKFPIVSIDDRQTYEDVDTSKDTRFFSDAGLIYFVEAAHVDASMYRSFQFQGTSFCAAPILNDSSGTAGFFAVGTNCCDGTFDCGSGKQGIVLNRYERRMFTPPDQHDYFAIAATAATETFGLTLRPDPIFVHLTENVAKERAMWESRLFGYTLLPSLIGIFGCLVASTALIIFFRRQLR